MAFTFTSAHLFLPVTENHSVHVNYSIPPGNWRLWSTAKGGSNKLDIRRLRCSARRTPEPLAQGSNGGRDGVEAIQRLQTIADDKIDGGANELGIVVWDLIRDGVDAVKSMFDSMGDGDISISAYDTAWVALVKDVNGSGGPQFPSSLQWIVDNQLPDGSWGDSEVFSAYDRLLKTLACVVALKSWNIRPDKCQKGLKFFRDNISKLEKENVEASAQMLSGFEVVFLSLIEVARRLDIQIPLHSPVFEDLIARRNLKFAKIPLDLMHNVPTSLLNSLEGMTGVELDWEKLLKLQSQDGSFITSPSSTAFALMQTNDTKCLGYLKFVVQKFNGGAPGQYPVEIFERIWVVDRLQRLGISRYFQLEIKECCLDYAFKHWTQYGSSWARNTPVYDLDDTCMAFRILRLHGYDVSAEAFRHFEKNGVFFCFGWETTQSVTVNFNLYRATQVAFPGENILKEAKQFSFNFLMKKQAAREFQDKWVILKDFPGELKYALEFPWYASLPRVETRFYVEQYGGDNDVWIGKTLYRMPYINNNVYLELAKLDFNNCQALHRKEWETMQKWFMESKLDEFGVSSKTLLESYFLAAASIFEPERSTERLAWAKTAFLMETIGSYFDDEMNSKDLRKAFVQEFKNIYERRMEAKGTKWNLIIILLTTLNHLTEVCGRDINSYLCHSWEKWMMMWEPEGDRYKGAAELLSNSINLSSGRLFSNDTLSHPNYEKLVTLSNKLCHQLGNSRRGNHNEDSDIKDTKIEIAMQELVQLVHQNSSDDISMDLKQTFFAVVRSFYYAAHCDRGTINSHIVKVLFESVV
uniref:Copal-8-ol diphosphate hydratase, chloroplastic n=1 Tax=Cistus creticus subsp. creticus TaxID=483148 RepID=CLDS_CISCR|nr:RecName: Full=Copal-8-ol diphosphate hydratase, chloroplastic; AltName: Full=Copal-8-ol diphosphate synthase; Short=CcCLS; Flags: Precursor [Cistus creticus subsp. creticus]ADJ93862.1 copal-8-ol diphosphate synthase [Cistus creticus subsp. creticus]